MKFTILKIVLELQIFYASLMEYVSKLRSVRIDAKLVSVVRIGESIIVCGRLNQQVLV